jgi:hypothetical protein
LWFSRDIGAENLQKFSTHWLHNKLIIVTQLLNIFTMFYGNWKYINVFTRAHHSSLSRAKWLRCHPVSLICILMLCISMYRSSEWSIFPSGCPTKSLHFSPLQCVLHTYCTHHILDLITLIVFAEEYKLWISIMQFSPFCHSHVQIFFSLPSFQTASCCSYRVRLTFTPM